MFCRTPRLLIQTPATNDRNGGARPYSEETRTEVQPVGHQKDGYEKYSRAKQSNLNGQWVFFFEPGDAPIVFWNGYHCDLQAAR